MEAAVFLVVNSNDMYKNTPGDEGSFAFVASDFSTAGIRTRLAPAAEAQVYGHILPAATLERDVDLLAVAAAAEAYLSSSTSSSSPLRHLSALPAERFDVRVLFRLGNGVVTSLGDAAPLGASAVNAATSTGAPRALLV